MFDIVGGISGDFDFGAKIFGVGLSSDDLPFDPMEFLDYELPYDPAMEQWGSEKK